MTGLPRAFWWQCPVGFAAGTWYVLVSKKENGAEFYQSHSTRVHMGTHTFAYNPGWQTLSETSHFYYKGSLVPSEALHGLIFGPYISYTHIIFCPPQCDLICDLKWFCLLGVCMHVNHTET